MEARRLNGNTTLQLSGHCREERMQADACYSDSKLLGKSSESAALNIFCQTRGLSLQDTAVFPSLTTSGYINMSISSPWAEAVRVESVHTPSGGSGRSPRAQGEWGTKQPPCHGPSFSALPGALLPSVVQVCWDHNTFLKNQSDFSLHFSLCLTCLSLTHCYVCGCSQCWCGFGYDTVIFYFLLANISCFTFFPHQSRDQR